MNWIYKGEEFSTITIPWEAIHDSINHNHFANSLNEYILKLYRKKAVWRHHEWDTKGILDDLLVYHPKHDACYYVVRFGVFGNGNRIKMCLEDVYTGREYYCQAKDVELVIKCN